MEYVLLKIIFNVCSNFVIEEYGNGLFGIRAVTYRARRRLAGCLQA